MRLDGLDVARVEVQEHPHGRKDLRVVDRLVLVDQPVPQSRRWRERAGQVYRENSELPDLQKAAVVLLRDRKSTRLNSSHGYISYAVFCLKKKKYERRYTHYLLYLDSSTDEP